MIWAEVYGLITLAKQDEPSPELLARQINSSSHAEPYYMFMRRLAMEAQEPGIFLEIGCHFGCVAAHITSVGTVLTHVGIDIKTVPFSHHNSIMVYGDSIGVGDNGLQTVDTIKRIADKCGGISHVFQDSSHLYESSVKEWELYSPLVKPGGLWISDDISHAFKCPDEDKGMVDYWDELPGDKRLFNDLHVGNTMGIIRL